MMGVLFAIFYFLLIRPQMKQQKEHKDMLANLTTGSGHDLGGIQGKITAVADNVVTLEIADKVRIKVGRASSAPSSRRPGRNRRNNQGFA
jgi:preprotein translocase subunit YajC